MSDLISRLESDESFRRESFPACRDRIFMAHAAVTAIPQVAISAMDEFNRASATGELDYSKVLLKDMDEVRVSAAKLIQSSPDEIALLGPTSLGLSLVANGISWNEGDEIITYLDDYPANVYPWKFLERKGVKVVYLQPGETGAITPELVEAAMTPKTRLLALASNNFLTGFRLDTAAIGALARKHGALFCLDAIQTCGAFETLAKDVDFMSADSHKWMLGPMTAGIVYVDKNRFEELEPSLLGAWNVKSPNFIAQDAVEFEPGGRRYEPGVLNAQGLVGMKASLDMLNGIGIPAVEARLLELKTAICKGLESMGFNVVGPQTGINASGITSFTDFANPGQIEGLYSYLLEKEVVLSFRHDRSGVPYLRFSPHFYNTHAEIEAVMAAISNGRT
ncbi:aminotransferase class V-fold PLP-dependent enzyme [Verrucomicrobiales bacterium BCK34]|nr:aminotransferase class V-fold PLP-dependent enzyme [Verrucomicrobiales bacterium BCK34]